MHIGQALDLVSRYDSLHNPLTSLGDYLAPEHISRCLADSGTVTLRKRRLPHEMMVWCIVGLLLRWPYRWPASVQHRCRVTAEEGAGPRGQGGNCLSPFIGRGR